MTPEDLDAIRERANNATKGPWTWGDNRDGLGNKLHPAEYPGKYYPIADFEFTDDGDAEFIAAARTDIPALLDHVVRLEQRVRARDITIQTLSSIHANRIDAVRELHTLYTDHRELQWCHHCETPWPCETIQALEGDPDA